MGLFSWNCCGCQESVKSPYDIDKPWQNLAVVVTPNEVITGSYDGYGRVGDFDVYAEYEHLVTGDREELWKGVLWFHARCFEYGSRGFNAKGSSPAEDQGHFYVRKGTSIEVLKPSHPVALVERPVHADVRGKS